MKKINIISAISAYTLFLTMISISKLHAIEPISQEIVRDGAGTIEFEEPESSESEDSSSESESEYSSTESESEGDFADEPQVLDLMATKKDPTLMRGGNLTNQQDNVQMETGMEKDDYLY